MNAVREVARNSRRHSIFFATQAPTWNYETVHFEIEVVFDDSPPATHEVLELLVNHVEQGRPLLPTWVHVMNDWRRLSSLSGPA